MNGLMAGILGAVVMTLANWLLGALFGTKKD